MALPHRKRRESDEWVCTRCHKRWPVGEDEPMCLSFNELTRRPEAPSREGPTVKRSSLNARPGDVFI